VIQHPAPPPESRPGPDGLRGLIVAVVALCAATGFLRLAGLAADDIVQLIAVAVAIRPARNHAASRGADGNNGQDVA
jgi:hypothetical protein